MRTAKQIIELKAAAYQVMSDLMKRAKNEARPMTSDEDLAWTKANADYEAYSLELQKLETMQAIDAEYSRHDAPEPPKAPDRNPESPLKSYMERLLTGPAVNQAEAMRLAKLDDAQRATTSNNSGNGSYTVPEEFMRMIEVFLKAYGGMFETSYIHRSRRGGTMNWPTIDDTAQTGQWVAEPRASAITPRAFSFDRKQFSAYTWTDIVALDWEFMQDEDVNFVASVMAELVGTSFGRALNKACTDGNGSGKPTGLLAASGGAGTGKTAASATAITKAELIDLQHSIDPAYANGPNVRWMFRDSTLAYFKKLDFGQTDTVPFWMPSFREGEPDTILGRPYTINQDFPSIATGAKSVAYGDFNKYVIRLVRDFNVVRLDERYADLLATGFLAWARVDAKLLNANAIKLLVQA